MFCSTSLDALEKRFSSLCHNLNRCSMVAQLVAWAFTNNGILPPNHIKNKSLFMNSVSKLYQLHVLFSPLSL